MGVKELPTFLERHVKNGTERIDFGKEIRENAKKGKKPLIVSRI
jgi:hypothetical protein